MKIIDLKFEFIHLLVCTRHNGIIVFHIMLEKAEGFLEIKEI